MGYWLVLIIGICGGAAVGIQSILAGAMGQKIGGTATSFIIHLGRMIFSGILLVLRGGENMRDWRSLPWYILGAGIFGLILYQTINVTLLRVGCPMMITLIIIGQLSLRIVIDHFGLFGIVTRHFDLPHAWMGSPCLRVAI
ncbi:MAG TPA: DMT family transporter [Anaerolineales bacterium]